MNKKHTTVKYLVHVPELELDNNFDPFFCYNKLQLILYITRLIVNGITDFSVKEIRSWRR